MITQNEALDFLSGCQGNTKRFQKTEPLIYIILLISQICAVGSDLHNMLQATHFYLLLNCDAFLAFLRPYFFLSFILGSLVKKPAFLSIGLNSASACNKALDIP